MVVDYIIVTHQIFYVQTSLVFISKQGFVRYSEFIVYTQII
jgi:hypothetical protein